MSDALSSNTQAILLLTAPLIVGRGKRSGDLLKPREYKKLARHLRGLEGQPADLLTPDADQLLRDCKAVIDKARLERLLGRGFLLGQALERWQARAIWVVSRADSTYPQRLKARLKENSPAVLYGCGERRIFNSGGLAVVGSRDVDDELTEFTHEIGCLVASAGRALVSGGARGIDQAAMRGALEAGGKVTGVLADSLERTAINREHRKMLLEGQLVLISPYDPSAGFNVGHAMQRNKLIYALADAALVVSADLNKGGTWAGATEQLDKLHLVAVYVRSTGKMGGGLEALQKRGALPWPNPTDANGLDAALRATAAGTGASPAQSQLSFQDQQGVAESEQVLDPALEAAAGAAQPIGESALEPADELFGKVRALVMRMLEKPCKTSAVASGIGITKRQAEEWLGRLVDEGVLEKRSKPVSYVVRQVDLFGDQPSTGLRAGAGKTGPGK